MALGLGAVPVDVPAVEPIAAEVAEVAEVVRLVVGPTAAAVAVGLVSVAHLSEEEDR